MKKKKENINWLTISILATIIVVIFGINIYLNAQPDQDVEKEVERLRAQGINLEPQGGCYMNWEAICENSIASCPGMVNNYYLENKNITIEDYIQSINVECNLSGSKDFVAIENEEYKNMFNETKYDICYKRCKINQNI